MDFFKEQPDFQGNKRHLKIIMNAIMKKDISIWNKWRKKNRKVIPNLQRIYLRGNCFDTSSLVGADFSQVDFKEAILHETNLEKVNLKKADLCCVDLGNANFSNADCRDANISDTNFTGTTLLETDMCGVNFYHSLLMAARLYKVGLSGANLYKTQIINCKIEGLECNYVYIDKNWKDRFPKNRNFKKGELEEILKANKEITQDLELSQ